MAEFAVPLPIAEVLLSDDGFGGSVDRQGHGLQRAFIFILGEPPDAPPPETAQAAK